MWIIGVVLLLLSTAVGWLLTVLGMPGNWLIVAAVGLYAYLVPDDWRIDVGWIAFAGVACFAVLGEIVEFAAGAIGTSRAGGSRRAAALALVGSIAGGICGVILGLPIPIPFVGQLVAAMLFAACGAMGGAIAGEAWKGRTLGEGWNVGKAAFWGRLFGTLGKILAGSIMAAIVIMSLFL